MKICLNHKHKLLLIAAGVFIILIQTAHILEVGIEELTGVAWIFAYATGIALIIVGTQGHDSKTTSQLSKSAPIKEVTTRARSLIELHQTASKVILEYAQKHSLVSSGPSIFQTTIGVQLISLALCRGFWLVVIIGEPPSIFMDWMQLKLRVIHNLANEPGYIRRALGLKNIRPIAELTEAEQAKIYQLAEQDVNRFEKIGSGKIPGFLIDLVGESRCYFERVGSQKEINDHIMAMQTDAMKLITSNINRIYSKKQPI